MNPATNGQIDVQVQCLGHLDRDFDPLDLHALDSGRYPFFLESSAGAAAQGRYDIVCAFPEETLCLNDGQLTGPKADKADFFSALDAWFQDTPKASHHSLPFLGGWFLYLGYRAASQVETGLGLYSNDQGLPDALAVRCCGAVIRDRHDQRVWIVSETKDHLPDLRRDVLACANKPSGTSTLTLNSYTEDTPDHYRQQVAAAREYIHAGDIFQTNLSREWRASLESGTTPADLYVNLRRHNPAPFSGLMQWGETAVISSSPERLIRHQHGNVDTRPIAGTRARKEGDQGITQELLAHPKERAEHVMLIDLERNDLGRVCEYGSVVADEIMTTESYAHVHHIVSNVSGRLRQETGPAAAIRAVFPGGTITGCPKVRCMEIINELEGVGRGAYTGAFGYLGLDGTMDTNILIRTLVQQGSEVALRAGAGIVADSDPNAELAETRAKARGMLLALGAES